MLREAFTERLKAAMRAKDTRTLSTVRLVLAGLKERDVAARGAGNPTGIADPEILRMLQGMVSSGANHRPLPGRATALSWRSKRKTRSGSSKAFCRAR